MTKEMLILARRNAKNASLPNATFVSSPITSIALPSSSADCVISNCINLVPHSSKSLVFKEIHRLLKPGGRVAVSDILARKELSVDITESQELYVECVSGASRVEEYMTWMKEAGFEGIWIRDTGSDLNVYKDGVSCCGSGSGNNIATKPARAPQDGWSDASGSVERSANSKGSCGAEALSGVASDSEAGEPGALKTCCSSKPVPKKALLSLADFDLNEWVGMYPSFLTKSDVEGRVTAIQVLITNHRLIPDLRPQIIIMLAQK